MRKPRLIQTLCPICECPLGTYIRIGKNGIKYDQSCLKLKYQGKIPRV